MAKNKAVEEITPKEYISLGYLWAVQDLGGDLSPKELRRIYKKLNNTLGNIIFPIIKKIKTKKDSK